MRSNWEYFDNRDLVTHASHRCQINLLPEGQSDALIDRANSQDLPVETLTLTATPPQTQPRVTVLQRPAGCFKVPTGHAPAAGASVMELRGGSR
jgi:hypothetical protein